MADDLTPRERFANRLRWHFDVVADEGRGSVYIGVGVQNALNDLDAMVAEERARHDDLAAALAALADTERIPGAEAPCPGSEACCGPAECEAEAMLPPWRLFNGDDLRSLLADPAAVLADRDRRMKAEAWDEAVRECHDLGWLHDFARSDALERNPYREGGRADD